MIWNLVRVLLLISLATLLVAVLLNPAPTMALGSIGFDHRASNSPCASGRAPSEW
jgi:hypothetical protein